MDIIKSIRKGMGTVLVTLLLLGGFSCGQTFLPSNQEKPIVQTQSAPTPPKVGEGVVNFKSKFVNSVDSQWKITTTHIGLGEKILGSFFLDRNKGWVFGKNLYKTEDGGTKWNRVRLGISKDAMIVKVFFLTENNGWVISQRKEADHSKSNENHALLLQTTDGGKSWLKKADIPTVTVRDLNFANENIGWLIGHKYPNSKSPRFEIYMLVTSDGGDNWKDVSTDLNEKVKDRQNVINQGVSAVAYRGGQIFVLSSQFQLFQTVSFGDSWVYIDDLPEPIMESTRIQNMELLESGTMWMFGGNYHLGGAKSMLLKKIGENWEKYELGDVYFSDGVHISEGEALVCGFKVEKGKKPSGVILYSLDGGKSWSTVLKSDKAHNVYSMQLIGNDTLIALDDQGTIVTLTRGPVHRGPN